MCASLCRRCGHAKCEDAPRYNFTFVSLLLLVLLLAVLPADARYCQDINVRNKVINIEKNLRGCEVIVGDLQIVLIDKATPDDFQGLAFPELREITGIVLIYQVSGLTSLGKLFPNLKFIHGQELFHNFALVIHKTPDLVEDSCQTTEQTLDMDPAEVAPRLKIGSWSRERASSLVDQLLVGRYVGDVCSPCLAMAIRRVLKVTKVLSDFSRVVESKYCQTINARNKIANIERSLRGCVVIVGNLELVLFDKTTVDDFEKLSFPDLREITGILLVYQVHGLSSLGRLLPNLKFIHGQDLFHNFALVLHNVPDLVEIGLSNLVSIEQGGVRIQGAPKLCYIYTIDWSKIMKYQNVTVEKMNVTTDFEPCPKECNGYCWNSSTCQTCMDDQHTEKCAVCRKYTDNGKCVPECPKNKYKLGFTCVTWDECQRLSGKDMYILGNNCTDRCPKYHQITNAPSNKRCVECRDNCSKLCNETVVDNIGSLQKLEGCTIINGSLTINGRYNFNLNPKEVESLIDSLPYYMDQIKEIHGSLKIHQMDKLKNLYFLTKLEKLGTNLTPNSGPVLYLVDNMKLNDLFPANVTKNLWVGNGSLAIHYNPLLCLQIIENFTIAINKNESFSNKIDISHHSNGDRAICHKTDMHVKIKNRTSSSVTLVWDEQTDLKEGENQMGYFVYYAEAARSMQSVSGCDNAWSSKISEKAELTLKDLEPFTEYTSYITTFTNMPSNRKENAYANFSTLPDDPSPPQNFSVTPINSSSVILSWLAPDITNGDLEGYKLYIYAEEDNSAMILTRNYCRYPHGWHKIEERVLEDSKKCGCGHKGNTARTFDQLCYDTELGAGETCRKYGDNIFVSDKRRRSSEFPIDKTIEANAVYTEYNISASETNFTIDGLEQFTLYVFLFSACNHPPNVSRDLVSEDFVPRSNAYCSAILMETARTLKNVTADVVTNITYRMKGKDCHINWTEPARPNQVIIAYIIECNKTDDTYSSFYSRDCVTSEDHARNRSAYVLRNLDPGSYSFTVYSISLAGRSKLGTTIAITISSEDKTTIIVVSVASAILIVVGAVGIWFYRKHVEEQNFKNLRMFASINPEYAGAIYEPDEWEMERENIEILKELGQGSFGMVHSGTIRSQNIPCAVKTINENCQHKDRMNFLNEASIMKSFNGAHHVVKLLGVVSKGSPPLVIMELMARGDLKSYLRRSRESSHDITCVEMYRMAVEIADGMLYLSAKKFIHRDLAARNCMVSADRTVKIGDFGMAKDIYSTDYYRQASRGMMPVRWMSPESLADGVFTSDSDVWSYGVVLWEMATLAEQPYQGLANEQVIQFIVAKGTLDRPAECPDLLYEIMQVCWKWKPIDRPRFTDIVAKLDSHISQDFKLVSFFHSREGEEYRMNNRERMVNPPALLRIPTGGDEYVGMHWNASDDDEVSLYSTTGKPKNSLLHRSRASSNFRLNSSTPKRSFSSKSGTPS